MLCSDCLKLRSSLCLNSFGIHKADNYIFCTILIIKKIYVRTDDGLLGLEQDNKTTACAHRGCTIQVARDLDQEMPVRDFPGGRVTRPHTPNAGDLGLIPGQATRSPILQLKIPHASTKTQCSQIF